MAQPSDVTTGARADGRTMPQDEPSSDASALATANLLREIQHLRDLSELHVGKLTLRIDSELEEREAHFNALLAERDLRYDTQLSERDLRYDQRYNSQVNAVEAAVMGTQLATEAALAATEKAIDKAEISHEKRFETVVNALHTLSVVSDRIERLSGQVEALGALTDAKFVTFRTLVDSQADKVSLALDSADKAINKAEIATEKRFDCCSADTPILCADLVWRPAGDLLPGDELIAFDEESPNRRGRRFRRSTVVANSVYRDALFLVSTPAGSVRCNAEHPWLVSRRRASGRPGPWLWVKTTEMLPGDTVLHSVDVWETDRSWEAGWLAGMMDGEGCLRFDRNGSVQLSVTQRESETSALMVQAMKSRVDGVGVYRVDKSASRPAHYQPRIDCVVSARADVMKVLGHVRPPRLLVNSDRIWEGKPVGGKHRTMTVTSIESVGTGLIAALGTSTRTYIGAGFAMHNSVNEFRAQLTDQAHTFMPRRESEQRADQLADKLGSVEARSIEQFRMLSSRLDLNEGRGAGLTQGWGYLVAAVGFLATLIGIVTAVIVVVN